jgi:hypothetical protein
MKTPHLPIETFILGSFQSFIYEQIKIAHCKPKKKKKNLNLVSHPSLID